MANRHQQRGLALVMVVVVVSIISLLTFQIAIGQQFWISNSQNLKDREQAEWIRVGALGYAAMMMERDQMDNTTDTLNESWASALPPLPVEGGKVAIKIEDMQGRFNLNNLVKNGQYNAEAGEVFRRLLQHAGVRQQILEPLLDWIDSDLQLRPGGAEDDYYLNLDPGYRSANRPLASVSELALIKGIDAETIEKLKPLVCALPGNTTVNINTAPTEVLAALFQGMTLDEAKAVVDYRKNSPFTTVADFKKAIAGKYSVPKSTIASTSSQYFQVTSFVEFGHYYQQSASLLYRPDKGKESSYLAHERPLITIAKDTESE